jgi:ribonuclease D
LNYNSGMESENLPDPVLITRRKALLQLAEQLTCQSIVAVDTESNSLYAYQEQVCLIQFSTGEADYLVDPLVLEDLSPLKELFANPAIEKVFHAAEYDLICMKRDFGFQFENIFDTMLAGRILGRASLGLGMMLEAEFGVTLDKRYQRANWGQRPLPSHLLSYARLDTHYLIPLRQRLYQELVESDRWPLAQEDFKRMCRVNGRAGDKNDETWRRVSGMQYLNEQQAAILKELCHYRDQQARRQNRPVFKILSDQILLKIAETSPSDLGELQYHAGVNRRLVQHYGNGLLNAVKTGLNAPPLKRPETQRRDEALIKRIEVLKNWRKKYAQIAGVESDVILPRDTLNNIAESNPRQLKELEKIMFQFPWRFERYGKEIINMMNSIEEQS